MPTQVFMVLQSPLSYFLGYQYTNYLRKVYLKHYVKIYSLSTV